MKSKVRYKYLNFDHEINAIRSSRVPRQDIGDELLVLELLNEEASKGWRLVGTLNRTSLTLLEKEYE